MLLMAQCRPDLLQLLLLARPGLNLLPRPRALQLLLALLLRGSKRPQLPRKVRMLSSLVPASARRSRASDRTAI